MQKRTNDFCKFLARWVSAAIFFSGSAAVNADASTVAKAPRFAEYESQKQMVASAELLASFLPAKILAEVNERGKELYTVETTQKILPDGSRLEYATLNRPTPLATLRRPEGLYVIKDDRVTFVAASNCTITDHVLARLPQGRDGVEYQTIALNAVKNQTHPVFPEVHDELSLAPESIQAGELDSVPCYIVTSVLDIKSSERDPDPATKFVRYFRQSDLLLQRVQWFTKAGHLQSNVILTYELEPADEDFALPPDAIVVEYNNYSDAVAALLPPQPSQNPATPTENPEKVSLRKRIKQFFANSDFLPWTATIVGILIFGSGILLHMGMSRAKKHS